MPKDTKADRASRFQWGEGDLVIVPQDKNPKSGPVKTDTAPTGTEPAVPDPKADRPAKNG
ncbi:MAG: hypothetical protein B7Y12_04140 [Rhizobiales bacterium 24-66-13]|jgi:hypothetical protein|nr:MAG: hypothetical protein B7Y61_02895 [Rhizobiales bacterium 35-66-30]OYZ82287.1 MAG: hypothetical protein B7Y12_04140 [Rhizobiales bacterium 24-66-13]OZB11086.1 MAG: hypothetical protein B7X67_05370 [Rhizobiales bacterium 39-66-18]